MNKLTHLDEEGAARMVDVTEKADTERIAIAEATISLSVDAFQAVVAGTATKGDVQAAARIAGIMAAKKTSELIPLCHSIALTQASVEIEPDEPHHAIRIVATVKTAGKTGVEMEALTAAGIAALTIYDMTKAIDKGSVIERIRLLSKSGGKSGTYRATSASTQTPRIVVRANRFAPAREVQRRAGRARRHHGVGLGLRPVAEGAPRADVAVEAPAHRQQAHDRRRDVDGAVSGVPEGGAFRVADAQPPAPTAVSARPPAISTLPG